MVKKTAASGLVNDTRKILVDICSLINQSEVVEKKFKIKRAELLDMNDSHNLTELYMINFLIESADDVTLYTKPKQVIEVRFTSLDKLYDSCAFLLPALAKLFMDLRTDN